jgi:hypothetical protein
MVDTIRIFFSKAISALSDPLKIAALFFTVPILWIVVFYICWNMVESMICHAKCDPAASEEVFYIIGAVFSSAIVAAIVTIILIMPAFLIMKYSLKQLRKMNKTK